MENNSQSNNELPSTKKLLKSTIIAIGVAAVILITTVLPAEYGLDPSGVGNMLGLLKMGEIKVSLSEKANTDMTQSVTNSHSNIDLKPSNYISQNGEITISFKPNEGRELKVSMLDGEEMNYSWYTDGGEIYFAAHTDSGEPHDYSEGTKSSDNGVLKAFGDGRHGWWYKNRTSEVVTLTLKVDGKYSDFREEF
jgi:hypothetical protein